MSMPALDHRGKRVEDDVKAGLKPGKDYTASMCAYHDYLTKGSCKEFAEESRMLFGMILGDRNQEDILQALLLGSYEFGSGECERALQVSEVVLGWYAELFFDVSLLSTRLMKISFVRSLPGTTHEDIERRGLLIRALDADYRYVLEHVGGREYLLGDDRGETTVDLWTDYAVMHGTYAAHKAINNHYAPSTSAMNKEARTDFAEVLTAREHYIGSHPPKQESGPQLSDIIFTSDPEELKRTALPRTQEIKETEFA